MVAAQNAAASGSTSACLTSAMEGYGAATYGDAIADVYDQWYSTRLDPTAAVDLLAELAGSGAVLELLSERVAQLNREKEALLQAVSVDQRTGLANAAAFRRRPRPVARQFRAVRGAVLGGAGRRGPDQGVPRPTNGTFRVCPSRHRSGYWGGRRALPVGLSSVRIACPDGAPLREFSPGWCYGTPSLAPDL